MLDTATPSRTESAVANLEAWFDTMRGPGGYCGPVVHWWRECLVFCGAALDWRYEGIIAGYLALFQQTGERGWLDKALLAGADIIKGQCADGCFRNSRFELNPGTGGTPHEAAADAALLLLAKTLRQLNDGAWRRCLEAARHNLEHYYLRRLWCPEQQWFRDDPRRPSFVPNKTATLIEALCLLAHLTGDDSYLVLYVRPAVRAILTHQVHAVGKVHGAIAQNTLGRTRIEKYFPYYIARCVPGLLAAASALDDDRYVGAAVDAMQFVWRWRDDDGAFPQVIYGNGRVNPQPRWVAAIGDILRAADMLRVYGLDLSTESTLSWLLEGQLPSGAFASARGFAGQVCQVSRAHVPDARDLLPVCGWNDKTFRYLAGLIHSSLPTASQESWTARCTFKRTPYELTETREEIALTSLSSPASYTWVKGVDWARLEGMDLC